MGASLLALVKSIYYQINWPTILDLESVGTGPSSHPILLLFWGNFLCFSSGVFKILESDLFQDNFTMALYSFGGVNDQCNQCCARSNRNACFVVVFVAVATLIAIKLRS